MSCLKRLIEAVAICVASDRRVEQEEGIIVEVVDVIKRHSAHLASLLVTIECVFPRT